MPRGTGAPCILVAGAGYVGLSTALRLERRLDRGEADILLVAPENSMPYQPLLPEVASGTLEPRHAVVPLRKVLRRTRLLTGRVTALDQDRREATITPISGPADAIAYDHVVLGVGSVTRMLPVPGLADHAVGFQTMTEAIHLHNHVLERLEAAEASRDADTRRRALTFTIVGGGYTGVELIAELEDMAASAEHLYPTVSPDDLRWVLVEATERILPTVAESLARHALHALRARGIEVRLETVLESVSGSGAAHACEVELSSGERFATDTLVWVAGVRPNPLVADLGLPTDDAGRLQVDGCLRVEGVGGAWGAGDVAAVPDGDGGHYPPTAQHAQREARRLADNLVAVLRGGEPEPFRYRSPGEFITLGNRKGIAVLYGRQLKGFAAWLLRRLYYVTQIPSVERKARILVEWAISSAFHREVVSLGSLEEPRAPIEEAAEHTG